MEKGTPEQVAEYHKNYYQSNKDRMDQRHDTWRKANPERVKAIFYRWLAKNPHYSRDDKRKHTAVVEPLMFEFIDNGFDEGDLNDFISCLRSDGISEQHIGWFKTDVQKYIKEAQ